MVLMPGTGTIASGGKTRRAAKMVILNIDHPDIEEFIWCKAREERKARVLEKEAGFDMGLNGKDMVSIQYQNAITRCVSMTILCEQSRVTRIGIWSVSKTKSSPAVKARDLFRQVASLAWESADPGMQFDTTINDWHTTPKLVVSTARIHVANICTSIIRRVTLRV